MGNSEAKPRASPITPSDGDSALSPLKRFANSARRDDPPNPEPSGSRAPAGKEQEQAAVQDEYPRRTGVPDCFYYVEFGSCKYGMNCKFNHPLKPSGWPAPAGQKHEQEQEYPRRPGEPDCAYYVRFGSCRYGMNCKFNHPLRNLVAKGVGSVGGGTNSGMDDDASSSQDKQITRSREPPLDLKIKSRQLSKAKYLPEKACMYNHHGGGKAEVEQVKLNFLGLPVRPGTRVCSYYMCWGTCKYGSNCKFHHPEPESEHENWDASRHAIQGSPQLNFSSGLDQEALKEQPVPFLAPSPSCRSGIIQPQGVYPYPERSGYQTDENKQGKPDWDPFSTKVFCDICADEVLAGNRPTNHLNAIGYNNLCAKFNEKTKKGYNHEQFKSKWEQLKKDYQMWKALMESEACLGWDPKKNTMSTSPEWWAEKMKAMPDCEKFRFAPLENVDLLNIMFEDMLDSSSTAPQANLAVNTTIRSVEGSGGANDIGIIDKEVNEQSEEATSQKSSNKEPKSTKPKTNYVHAALNHLVDFAEEVNPSNSMTSRKIDQVGCGISEIMELVVDAGAGEGSDEHFIATQLFIRPEYREMFLTLKTPQGRLVWLRRMCQEKEK